MKLEFPTMAEKTLAEFNAKTKTLPLQHFALKRGAFKEYNNSDIIWIFDDDTRLIVSGRGKNYTLKAELP